jgi:signal transduction histidine kinase
MLHDFIVANREEIIERTRTRLRARTPQKSIEAKLDHGVPIFLTQLVEALAPSASTSALHLVGTASSNQRIADSAALHGQELLRNGFTLAQVVHGYGDICQVVTTLAADSQAPISADDFHVFNRCLDDAIAGAVTAHGTQRERDLASNDAMRLGIFGHELRNLLGTAVMAFDVIRKGTVGLGGSTGAILARSLSGLGTLIDRSLAEVRLEAGLPIFEHLSIVEFMEEIELSAAMEAEGHGIHLTMTPIENDVAVNVDRQLLASAVSNLIQNAFKFTRPGSDVTIATRATQDRVLIEVGDECGGLPPGKADELFQPFSQKGKERSGLGLGLSIARAAAQANGGDIRVRDIAGTGCVFTVDMPRLDLPPASVRALSDRPAKPAADSDRPPGRRSSRS